MKYFLTKNSAGGVVRYIPETAVSRLEHNEDGTWTIILLDGASFVIDGSPRLFNPFGE